MSRLQPAKGATRAQAALGRLFARDRDALTRTLARELRPILDDIGAAAEAAYLAAMGEPKSRKVDTSVVDRVMAALDLKLWLPRFARRFERHYRRTASQTVTTINDALDLNVSITEPALATLERTGGQRTRLLDLDGDTRQAILQAIKDGTEAGDNPRDVARRIRDRVPAGHFVNAGAKYRAELIARTETLNAQRLASITAYEQSPVVTATLALDGDDDPDCAARNGREFTFAEARDETAKEHPNGTLAWTPVVG